MTSTYEGRTLLTESHNQGWLPLMSDAIRAANYLTVEYMSRGELEAVLAEVSVTTSELPQLIYQLMFPTDRHEPLAQALAGALAAATTMAEQIEAAHQILADMNAADTEEGGSGKSAGQ